MDNEHIEYHDEAPEMNPQIFAMREAISRSGMRLTNANPQIKRNYVNTLMQLADRVEQEGGMSAGAIDGLTLIFALLDLDSPEAVHAFIGEETDDSVQGFITVCRGIAAKLETMAQEDEAQGK